jgi:hypothetical protein
MKNRVRKLLFCRGRAMPPAIDFDTAAVDQAMGYKGKANTASISSASAPRR